MQSKETVLIKFVSESLTYSLELLLFHYNFLIIKWCARGYIVISLTTWKESLNNYKSGNILPASVDSLC